jgi:hypothetical protein
MERAGFPGLGTGRCGGSMPREWAGASKVVGVGDAHRMVFLCGSMLPIVSIPVLASRRQPTAASRSTG